MFLLSFLLKKKKKIIKSNCSSTYLNVKRTKKKNKNKKMFLEFRLSSDLEQQPAVQRGSDIHLIIYYNNAITNIAVQLYAWNSRYTYAILVCGLDRTALLKYTIFASRCIFTFFFFFTCVLVGC